MVFEKVFQSLVGNATEEISSLTISAGNGWRKEVYDVFLKIGINPY